MAEQRYAKVINTDTKACDVGLGTNSAYYASIGMTLQNVEKSYDGNWYLAGYAPSKSHEQEIKEQILELEASITDRNMRGAILGDEYAINKVRTVEGEIALLREQLVQNGGSL